MTIQLMKKCSVIWLVVLGILEGTATAGSTYRFVNIADNSGPFNDVYASSINALGDVAILAFLDNGQRGIYVGNGGPVSLIQQSSAPFVAFGYPVINDSGSVAYSADLSDSSRRIHVANGASVTTIADTAGAFALFRGVWVNNHGSIAFGARLDSGTEGIYVAEGGVISTIVDSVGELSKFGPPHLNDLGSIVFTKYSDGEARAGIYVSSAGTVSQIVERSGDVGFDNQPRINDSGVISFRLAQSTFVSFLYTASAGSLNVIEDSNGEFEAISSVGTDVNDRGAVLFGARTSLGHGGIYLHENGHAAKVIERFDPLFGSTVKYLQASPRLNNRGDVLFKYELKNGVVGLAVASPVPEPTAWMLALIGLVGVHRGRARRYAGWTPRRTSG